VHTGHHFDADMFYVVFEKLRINKLANILDIGTRGHGTMTGRVSEQVENVFLTEKKDFLLIHGDTNLSMAGDQTATKLHIPVVYVEAGLCSPT
jgi:UDP-N-acetylglucosamine 2-epimerase